MLLYLQVKVICFDFLYILSIIPKSFLYEKNVQW